MAESVTVGGYLLSRLKPLGVDHVFGIPGDYILPFFTTLANSDVRHIATCNELNAGYAADGYARCRGLGAIAVTYGPGAFSTVNAVAGAFAERVPVVVISGGPPAATYDTQPHLHHILPGRYEASLRIFEPITAAARVIRNPETAAADIDEVLGIGLAERRPVYLEIAMDVQSLPCKPPVAPLAAREPAGDPAAARLAVGLIAQKLDRSQRVVLLAGHELLSYGLTGEALELVTRTGSPVASLFSGKANYLEHLPECMGVYQGAGSDPAVRAFVEGADAVLFLGAVASDFNLGGGSAGFRDSALIEVFDNQVQIADERIAGVGLAAVVRGLLRVIPEGSCRTPKAPSGGFNHCPGRDYAADEDRQMTNKRLYDRLARFIRANDIVLADAGCLINVAQIRLPPDCLYIAAGYWASIGMGFGAAVGACFAAQPGQRVIALEGDGSFQMTAQELSTLIRYDQAPIVIIVNNRGYTAERLIHDGPFNDIQNWQYHRLPEPFGGVSGADVHTEGDLERALERAETHQGPGPLVIEVHIDPMDASAAFRSMSEGLRGH